MRNLNKANKKEGKDSKMTCHQRNQGTIITDYSFNRTTVKDYLAFSLFSLKSPKVKRK